MTKNTCDSLRLKNPEQRIVCVFSHLSSKTGRTMVSGQGGTNVELESNHCQNKGELVLNY